ncbi:NDP-hexose 2,3-dehydratase family protein [Ruminococcus difficilis]|uniref:NDP-hexose 2,3-dehydratase family protein n=1 Tax=Ruminococcus difficilis TaxID=2763069 RepID=A0A934WPB4_9FIRM|nr:NDP-hexose 2,3-dehydratase family protein [Ruminococcus difficilis]MBK6087621.1 NDP-hexose 2,3-dehydratase family protein [Ruminococcus difficilis]
MGIDNLILQSWNKNVVSIHDTDDLLDWVNDRNKNTIVNIRKTDINKSTVWFYDNNSGLIRNQNNSFFQITGIRITDNDTSIAEQPIILQTEIGYLGIICKVINGVLHFLMQSKIEPGNINCVQISPTIQATKSNFTQKHGGAKPKYLEYFLNANKYKILFDQIQSEQSSRFLGKRNRNIIILVNEDVPESATHKWMTLYQIKQLMKIPNLVNMDTRTVLSSLPIIIGDGKDVEQFFEDKDLFRSMFNSNDYELPDLYHYINDYKMFHEQKHELVPLYSLNNWDYNQDKEFICKQPYSFRLIHCDIEIEGREVRHWDQPLFEAMGRAMFGLLTCIDNSVRKYLVKAKPEIGAFDRIEFGPSVQREAVSDDPIDPVYSLFKEKLAMNDGVLFNNVLSEEGGRFYHEENDNIIIQINKDELRELPDGYFWVTYRTLNSLIQINNTVNIQLRNLISLLEI